MAFFASRLGRAAAIASVSSIGLGFLAINNNRSFPMTTAAAGESPADCKETACKSTIDILKQSMGKADGRKKKEDQSTWVPEPPTREVLGRAGWLVLHCFAAYYPDNPTEEEKAMALAFLKGFAHFYPCKDCAEGLKIAMEDHPPNVETRTGLSIWMCEIHNQVNELLGKPAAPCDIASLDKRWRG